MEKILNYMITPAGAFPEETLCGGVQGENKATAIAFDADPELSEKIAEIKNEGKEINAKIKAVTVAGECVGEETRTGENLFSPFYLTDRITSSGLDIIIVFALIVVEEQRELCKAQIKLCFIPSPLSSEFVFDDNSEAHLLLKRAEEIFSELDEKSDNISNIMDQKLETVKNTASVTAEHLKKANEVLKDAEKTRLSLEGGMEFVFSGGDAYNSANADLVIDDELSETSDNAVSNKAVAQSFKECRQEIESLSQNDELISKDIEELKTDYIVEQGTSGVWTYRKWASGISECEAAYDETVTTKENNDLGRALFLGSLAELNFPTGIFTNIPVCAFSINSAGYPMARIHTLTNSLIRLRCFTEWAINDPARVSIIAKGRWK